MLRLAVTGLQQPSILADSSHELPFTFSRRQVWSVVWTLSHLGIPIYGFRVCEPHHDGTPHWHLLLFMRPVDKWRVISALQHYALSHD